MDIFLYVLLGIVAIIVVPFLLWLLFIFIASIFVKDKDYYSDSRFYRFLLNFSTRSALGFCRVKVKVLGKEKFDNINGRFLLVSNHRSNFDPIIEWYEFRKQDVAFISKGSNFSIPIFGKIVRRCCFRRIDRVNPKNAIKTIYDTASLMEKDVVSIGIYPEGTRSKNCVLLPFHDGVLKIAKLSHCPIVVCSIVGTELVKKNFPFRKTVVKIEVCDVIDSAVVDEKSTHDLADDIRQTMENSINNLENIK